MQKYGSYGLVGQAGRWLVTTACGERGERCMDRTSELCCERRNPALQLVYVAILGVTYHLYARDVFALLPTQHAPAWHMCGLLSSLPTACLHYPVRSH